MVSKQLYLLSDSRDSVLLFDLTSGASLAPPNTADSATRSQWLTRDAATRLAVRNHLPLAERAHFGQQKTARALYDAVVARYSSSATAALGRPILPYLFPKLSAFATVADLGTHLCTSDTRYCATLPADFLAKNPPPMYITLYYIVTRLPDSLSAVRDLLLALDPTELTADLLEKHLLAAETSIVAAASAPGGRCRSGRGKGGQGGGGGGGSGGGSGGVGGGVVAAAVAAMGVAVAVVGRQREWWREQWWRSGWSYSKGRFWRWPKAAAAASERDSDAPAASSRVDIFDLDYDAILAPMYALSVSADGDCYLCVPPDPGIEAAALGACESALRGTMPAEALHTFTLESGASHCFFRDSTTLTPLSAPVPASLADPSGGQVLPRSSTLLPCPAILSSSLSGLHLPSFSTNLMSTAALQDAMVTTTTPGGQRVSICTCTRTGRHLATFTRRPGSSLYILSIEPPQVAASAQVSAPGPVATPCSCRRLSHQNLLWHHRLGHPSLPRLCGMHSRLLVSGLPRSLPLLPPSPCVKRRQRAAPHSYLFPPTSAPLQTLHMDVWGPAHDLPVLRLHSDRGGEFSSDLLREFCRGEGIFQSFTLPTSPQQNGVVERRIGLGMEVARTSMIHAAAPHFLWSFAVRYAAHQLKLWPRISLPETSPTLRWTGKVGDASVFRVWGSRAFVRDIFADKFSARTVTCVFLGFPPDAPGWQFYHPTSRRVLPSQDVTFDESVPFYCLFPYRSAPLPPPPLFIAPSPPPVDPLPPQGPAPAGVCQVDPLPSTVPVDVAVDSGAARGAASGGAEPARAEHGGAEPAGAESEGAGSGGAEPGGAEPGGTEPAGAEPGSAESEGAEPMGAESEGAEPGGSLSPGGPRGALSRREPLSPPHLCEWFSRRTRLRSGAAGARRSAAGGTVATEAGGAAGVGAGGTGAGAAGVSGAAGPGGARTGGTGAAGAGGTRAGVAGVTGATGPGGARTGGTGPAGAGGARTGVSRAAGAGGAAGVGAGDTGAGRAGPGGAGAVGVGFGDTGWPRPYFVPLLQQVLGLPSSTTLTPPLLCPPPEQTQPPLQPASALPAPTTYTEQVGGFAERRKPVSRPASLVPAVRTGHRVPRPSPPSVPGTHHMALRPSSVQQRVPLPSPPVSTFPDGPDPESDLARAASPTVPRLLATVVTDPSFEYTATSALLTELVDFAAFYRLDYATALVAESESTSPPSVEGECALGTDVLEDKQEEFECLAAALPSLVAMLLALEGDPDAPDIPTPRSYVEAIKGTYVDAVPPHGANIVDGMCIFRMKRPPGSPPAFKACYVAQGFSQRQEVDFFHTFSPTPKMTTHWVLLHFAAQCDYELHSLDFSTAFLQGSLHEEIWLCRPPGFTESFPAGTQWSLRRPVYGLRQAPREWHDTVRTTLAALGLAPSTTDSSLFLCTDTSPPPFYVRVYVDDLVFATADTEALTLVKSELQKRHTCTDLGPSALRLLVLLATTHSSLYQPLALSTSGMGLVLGGRGPVVLTGHADASWVDDLAAQRPTQGYTFSLGSGSVSWRSTRSSSVLSSSCEAEIYAGAMAAQELRWLTYLLTDLGERPRSSPVMYVDNKATIALCQEHKMEHRTKHIVLLRWPLGPTLLIYSPRHFSLRCLTSHVVVPCLLRRPALPVASQCWLSRRPDAPCRIALLAVASPCPARASHCWQPRRPALPAHRPVLPALSRPAARTTLLRATLLLAPPECCPPCGAQPFWPEPCLQPHLCPHRPARAAMLLPALLRAALLADALLPARRFAAGAPPCWQPHHPALPKCRPAGLRHALCWPRPSDPVRYVAIRLTAHKTAKALYDAVVARYSSPATAALDRLILPYLFPELSAFATVEDLVTHLQNSDTRYRAALPAKFLDRNPPPMYITLYFIVTRLPNSLRCPYVIRTEFGDEAERPRWLELLRSGVDIFALDYADILPVVAELVAAVGVVAGVGASVAAVVEAVGVGVVVVAAVGVVAAAVVAVEAELFRGEVLAVATGSDRAGQTCEKLHTQHRCFSRLDDAWRVEIGDEVVRPRWAKLLRPRVDIFALDYDYILAAMYALSVSAEGDCYLCVPPDPGIEAATLGATESALLGAAPAEVLDTFTLDSGASRCFFHDSTTLTPLPAPLPVRLADPSRRPVLARSTTVLPCPVVPSSSLSGLHLLSFSTNLVNTAGLMSHQTLLRHHRAGHPSLPCLRGMHSRLLVSGLPRSLPPLSPLPAPPCLPCVEWRQRAAPHSSSFPPTTAPLQTLHMDVWGPARVSGQDRERYFLLVVDDYTRYTTVFPCAVRVRGGEFSSDLLQDFCHGEGILELFTLPASPQQNGVAERRIGLVIEMARTSMIHAIAPHFLWSFAVRYVSHHLNLWSRVSLPETSLTLRWTRKVGDASVFRVWGSQAFVRDSSTDKLSCRAIPCVFLGFPPDAPGWQFYHPTSRRVLPSQGITFDKLVPFYRLFPYRFAPLPPPRFSSLLQVHLWWLPSPLRVLLPQVCLCAEPGGVELEGAEPGGAKSEGAKSRGAELEGAEPRGTEPEGAEPGGFESEGAETGGAEPRGSASTGGLAGTSPRLLCRWRHGAGGAGATGPGGACTSGTGVARVGGAGGAGAGDPGTGAGDPGAGGAGAGDPGAGGTGAGGVGSGGAGAAGGAGAGDPRAGGAGAGGAGAGGPGAGGTVQRRPFFVPLQTSSLPPPDSVLRQVLSLPSSTGLPPSLLCPPPHLSQPHLRPDSPLRAPSPYAEQTERREPGSRLASPVGAVCTGHRVPRPRPPPVPGTHIMALRPSSVPLRVPLPSPRASSLPDVPDRESNLARATSPTDPHILSTVVTDPSFESTAASALVVELVHFAAACRLDYAAILVAESESDCPPSVGGECPQGQAGGL
ncbi:unnamed protein product [Closterium sp. NIES-53]